MEQRGLILDGGEELRAMLRQGLSARGYDVVDCSSEDEALEAFERKPFPLLIAELDPRRGSGTGLLRAARECDEDTTIVVLASAGSTDALLGTGGYDVLVKPCSDPKTIAAVVNRAVERVRLVQQNRALMQHVTRHAEELDRLGVQLTDMATRDSLTGLYNHRFFREALFLELSRARRHRRPFSVILADVDDFRPFNDAHGQLAGDDVLRTVAGLIQGCCRNSTVFARYGGDEFVLLVPEIASEGALRFSQKLCKAVENHPFVGGETQPLGRVTVSLGVASFPSAAEDAASIVDRAVEALARAKQFGRNGAFAWQPARA